MLLSNTVLNSSERGALALSRFSANPQWLAQGRSAAQSGKKAGSEMKSRHGWAEGQFIYMWHVGRLFVGSNFLTKLPCYRNGNSELRHATPLLLSFHFLPLFFAACCCDSQWRRQAQLHASPKQIWSGQTRSFQLFKSFARTAFSLGRTICLVRTIRQRVS